MTRVSRLRLLSATAALAILPLGLVQLQAGSASGQAGASAATPAPAPGGGAQPKPADERPNIVLLLADDLDARDLARFPNISRFLMDQGTTFTKFFVSDSWCCPSRATILRSQYVHSHQVLTNIPPHGGFGKFPDDSTIATWLKGAGYQTALMGKYLNRYPEGKPKTYIPPGWDEWQVPLGSGGYRGYDYTLNSNGTLRKYGKEGKDYLGDVLTRKATSFINRTEAPFFLYLAPFVPHLPATTAPRHAHAFADVQAPRTPSFNQANLSAEPRWLRSLPKLGPRQIKKLDDTHRQRLRSMLGVDEMIGTLIEELRVTGKLDNTYFLLSSDNGWHMGQHRLPRGKTTPFEEDIRIPMLVRGPGVAPGARVDALGATVDLAPTFAELAGAATPGFIEGRSLVPFLRGQEPAVWRDSVLVEFFSGRSKNDPQVICDKQTVKISGCPFPPSYATLRTDKYTYVEYVTGERQLYDLDRDPHQMRNIVTTAAPELLRELSVRLERFAECSAQGCRVADSESP
ncbi:sulfatase family protein [Rhizohabitans arisaemae]|uniref:sulfatase family protein n=1 Tax=Rhizohabitans arisaemae TaxID=2720610 RepID=UPI0024B077EA|nr:sulfatase [Rhizohabitans arisaemae]